MRNKNVIFSIFWFVGLSLLSIDGYSKEEIYTDKLVQKYLNLMAYCDTLGTFNHLPSIYPTFVEERCYQVNGAYKVIYTEKSSAMKRFKWSDAETIYSIIGYIKEGVFKAVTRSYQEKKTNYSISDKKQERFIKFILNRFIGTGYYYPGFLDYFKVNHQLSNDDFVVLDYSHKRYKTEILNRFWVSKKDTLIIKSEEFKNSERVRLYEISNIRINPLLTREDLEYAPSMFTKYSLSKQPVVFLAVLSLLTLGISFVYWVLVFLGNKDVVTNTIPWPNKHKFWKKYISSLRIGLGILFVIGIISALLSMLLFVIAFKIIMYSCGPLVLVISLALLAAHPAHWFAEKLIRWGD